MTRLRRWLAWPFRFAVRVFEWLEVSSQFIAWRIDPPPSENMIVCRGREIALPEHDPQHPASIDERYEFIEWLSKRGQI